MTTLTSLEFLQASLKVVQQLMTEGYDGLTIDNIESRLKARIKHYKERQSK